MIGRWTRLAMAAVAILATVEAAPSATMEPATQPTTQPSPQVQALIDDLTSDSFETRQDATKKLIELGQSVEPQLRAALAGDLSDEARARVTAALRGIQERKDFGPSIITLHYKNAPLTTILNDFSAQAGADLGVRRPEIVSFLGNRKGSVDLDHVSFWAALETISQISNLHPEMYNGNSQMMLGNSGWMNMDSDHSVVSGAFIISPQSSTFSIMYTRGGGNASLSLNMYVVAEPKLHIVGNINQDWLKECVDDKGHSLMSGGQQPMYFNQSHWWWQLNANLAQPAGIGSKIAKLKGEMKVAVETKSEVFLLNNLPQAQNVAKTIGTTTLTIEQCVVNGSQCSLHLSVNRPNTNRNNPWAAMQETLADVQVLDADDRPLQQNGSSYSMPTPTKFEAQVEYTPTGNNGRPTGPPAKLRWEAPTETENRTVTFELDNLELPTAH